MTKPTLKENQQEISDILTEAGFENVKKGQVLTFIKNGESNDYKIVRLNRSKKICIVEPIELTEKMTDDEATDLISEKMNNDEQANTTTS